MFQRALKLPATPQETFFLWGPRQAGKSTLLHASYPRAAWIDLLNTDQFIRYTQRPALLREELLRSPKGSFVIIDEIQKVPPLLDEVHWLIENAGIKFGLCGSSARKLKRGHANLLGGRAVRYELFGLVSAELGDRFELEQILNRGYLPRHVVSENYRRLTQSYVQDYLKEEIAGEGLVRQLPPFSNFLSAAALSDAELVNYSTIARDCGVSGPAVREYFQILVDTLLGRFLPAYAKRPKRRVIQSPKFYFADVGVVNHLAKRGSLQIGGELFGKAFENWVFHELNAYSWYKERFCDLAYWRLASGTEVDFIVNDMELAIEAKASRNVTADHLRGLRALKEDHPKVKRRLVVSLDPKARTTEDGIEILPYQKFAHLLWEEKLI